MRHPVALAEVATTVDDLEVRWVVAAAARRGDDVVDVEALVRQQRHAAEGAWPAE
jgi:hypothetical protein